MVPDWALGQGTADAVEYKSEFEAPCNTGTSKDASLKDTFFFLFWGIYLLIN